MLLPGALLVALALAAAWFTDEDALWEGIREAFGSPETLRGYVLGFGVWAPVVFFLAQAAQVILVPLPVAPRPSSASWSSARGPAAL